MSCWAPTLNLRRRTKQISQSEKVLVQYNEYNSKIARQVLVNLKAFKDFMDFGPDLLFPSRTFERSPSLGFKLSYEKVEISALY